MQINGEEYLYVKNIQGYVIAMVDDTGWMCVKYKYDAWGNVLSVTGSKANTIGNLNPMRY